MTRIKLKMNKNNNLLLTSSTSNPDTVQTTLNAANNLALQQSAPSLTSTFSLKRQIIFDQLERFSTDFVTNKQEEK